MQGIFFSLSKKHKLNTKSSTEAELVGVDDASPQVLWSMYFTEAQGYSIDQNIMFQDNMATTRLESNGSFDISRKTKHTKARYFFI